VNRTPFLSSRRRLRRLAVLATGALLGLGGVLAIAAPASAHHSEVSGVPHCDTTTGEWVVNWTVDSVAPEDVHHYKLVEVNVTPADHPVTGIAVTTDDTYPHEVGKPLTGEQRLPGKATDASLSVKAKWENGFEEDEPASKTITFGGTCEQDKPKPNVSFESACDGTVTVTLMNGADATATAKFTVTAGEFSKDVSVEKGKSEQVVVPAKDAAKITVTSGDQKFTGGFEQPEDCAPVEVASLSDCDSLTISIENPEGNAPVEATLTPKGGEAQTVTVAPGETKEVKFEATEGTVVTLTIGDQSGDIPWENPGDCESPSPAPGAGGGGPTLPTTGSSIGTAVGIAAVLLAAGTGLFFFFRRRRIRFTA
jgi:LPXTG-motif cell wall-anchored protein